MKISVFLLIITVFSQISLYIGGTIQKSYRNRRKSAKKQDGIGDIPVGSRAALNKWYQLFVGMFGTLANLSEQEIINLDQCIPDAWKVPDSVPGHSSAPSGQSGSSWNVILDGLEKVIEMVCKFKSQIVKLFVARIRRLVRRYKYKILLQRSLTSFREATQWFGGIGDLIKKATGSVGNFADMAFNSVKELAKGFVKKAMVFVDAIKDKVNSFLSPTLIEKIKKFKQCIEQARSAAMKVIESVKKLFKLIKKIIQIVGGDMVTLGRLIIDLICNFSLFRRAFTYLIQSFNTDDTLRKFNLIGKFLGTFLRAASSRRLFLR
jgi:hypothetical protein